MNAATRYILGIYQVELMIRDTLEYGIIKQEYNVEFYQQRKVNFNHGLEENSPLSNFLKQNGEVGTKIRAQLEEFQNDVYADESKIVKLIDEKIVVDRGCIIQLYDYIVGLHETLSDIINGFIKHSETDGSAEAELKEMIQADDYFYRSLSGLVIFDEIHRSFGEFNKCMKESKGQANPQTNFILNDLKRLVGFLKFTKEHSKLDNPKYLEAYDKSFLALNYMEGSKKLEEGESILTFIQNAHEAWQACCQDSEGSWRELYVQLWTQLVDYEKNMAKSNNSGEAKAN